MTIQQSLDSYAAGVNAYLNGNATLPEMQPGVDPGNIALRRPADSVWGKLMSLELSGNLMDEMLLPFMEVQVCPLKWKR